MKNYFYGVLTALLLLVCCSGNTSNNEHYTSLPRMKEVAEGSWGKVSKYKDGNNLIYVYERSGGGSGITVVKDGCP